MVNKLIYKIVYHNHYHTIFFSIYKSLKNTEQRQQSSLGVTETMLVDAARAIARIGEDFEVNLKI